MNNNFSPDIIKKFHQESTIYSVISLYLENLCKSIPRVPYMGGGVFLLFPLQKEGGEHMLTAFEIISKDFAS